MDAVDRLLATDAFDFSDANRKLFVESFREACWAHFRGNDAFRAFWTSAGLDPDAMVDEESLEKAVPIMVHLFKERELVSVPADDIVLRLTSSGTGGQKSQMLLNRRSLDRVKRAAWKVHEGLGLTGSDTVDYICFTYDPHVAKDLGTAFTDELLTSFTGRGEVHYAIRFDPKKNDFAFDSEGTAEALLRFARGPRPVRLLGFPAFLFKLIEEHDLRVRLGPAAFVQTGGGWKTFADEEIPKGEFRRFVADRLGLPEANIRDMFGMVEHGIAYVDCRLGRLHVPNYARVFVRSEVDLALLPEGETGLVHFLCSYNDSYPSISLLTTDWGRLGRCDCGLAGQTLEILGRAGVSKHKGCAIKAAELMKGA